MYYCVNKKFTAIVYDESGNLVTGSDVDVYYKVDDDCWNVVDAKETSYGLYQTELSVDDEDKCFLTVIFIDKNNNVVSNQVHTETLEKQCKEQFKAVDFCTDSTTTLAQAPDGSFAKELYDGILARLKAVGCTCCLPMPSIECCGSFRGDFSNKVKITGMGFNNLIIKMDVCKVDRKTVIKEDILGIKDSCNACGEYCFTIPSGVLERDCKYWLKFKVENCTQMNWDSCIVSI